MTTKSCLNSLRIGLILGSNYRRFGIRQISSIGKILTSHSALSTRGTSTKNTWTTLWRLSGCSHFKSRSTTKTYLKSGSRSREQWQLWPWRDLELIFFITCWLFGICFTTATCRILRWIVARSIFWKIATRKLILNSSIYLWCSSMFSVCCSIVLGSIIRTSGLTCLRIRTRTAPQRSKVSSQRTVTSSLW